PSATILDGGGDTVVAFHNGEGRGSILESLTVQNGAPIAWQGGGIYISGASPTIQDDIIQNNIGCGIGSFNSAPLISGNVVSGTTEPLTGGPYSPGKFPCTDPSGEVDINTAEGTGIFVYGTSTDGLVTEILGNIVTGNIGSPAAMYLADSGVALVENNVVTENTSSFDSGISVVGHVATLIIQNVISDNATDTAGAINPTADATGGLDLEPFCGATQDLPVIVADNTIVNNSVVNWPTGFLPPGTEVFTDGCYDQISFYNNVIAGTGSQPIIRCQEPADVTVSPPKFYYNDVFASGSGPTYYEDCPNVTGTNGSISADPLFAASNPGAQYPYQLQLQSPAVDSGDNNSPDLPATDILGRPRIQDAKGLPTAIVDMGAYEYPGVPVPGSPDFMMTVSPQTLTLNPGSSAPVNITLSPNGYFSGDVSLSCEGLPADLACSFGSQQLQLGGGVPSGTTLTVRTVSLASAAGSLGGGPQDFAKRLVIPWLACVIGLTLFGTRRPAFCRTRGFLSALSVSALALALFGCGVTFGAGGTYVIEVSAAGHGVSHQVNLTVTIPR
ncbi:MAG: right-handed parallel beta-helix repeat-containing protein, partial [Acidobacteriaceae bacterium]